jgi:hypothetical protein
MIKLDSGNYINTEAVEVIKGGDNPYIVTRCGDVITITPADRDRIVEAINGPTVATAQQDGLKPFTAEDFKHIGRGNA